MVALNQKFIADDMPKGQGNFDPLPAGWYNATISGAEVKKTKSGTGEYISVRYDITGPTHQGRVVFANLNIMNASPKAEEIGRQQLGEIMRATGIVSVSDSDQLIGGQLQIKLSVDRSEQYGDKNEVKGFKPLAGGFAPSAQQTFKAAAPAQPSAPPAAQKAAPPWARK